MKVWTGFLLCAAFSVSSAAIAAPGMATINGVCIIKRGDQVAACLIHKKLPQMMQKTVEKACAAQGVEYKSEWKQDGTCPKEGLLGTCINGDDTAYSVSNAYYKWDTGKLDTVEKAKATCTAGKWVAP